MVLKLRQLLNIIQTRWLRLRRWQQALSLIGVLLLIVDIGFYLWIFADLPSIDKLQAGLALPSTRILDRNGRLLYEIINKDSGRNIAVPLSKIPPDLINATIATEDR